MRKVQVIRKTYNKVTLSMDVSVDYIAKFHQFGVDSEEADSGGCCNYTVAILEKDDGSIVMICI